MDMLERFYNTIRSEMVVTLATAAEGSVTMRVVSPVYYDGEILIFTDAHSTKFRQLKENPACCLAAGTLFAEATATLRGGTMLPENEPLRAAYDAKFPGAFAEGPPFGGREADFILLRPTRLSGWTSENADDPPEAMVPFELLLGE